jgi:hypothetical protein
VRSGTEAAAARQIEDYDRWYAEFDVQALMSDRMHMKDKKKPRSRLSSEL